MELISRPEAKKRELTHYFTGKFCKYGHISKRFISTCKCFDCGLAETAKYSLHITDPEKNRIRIQEWRDKNPERAREVSRIGQKKYQKTTKGQLRKFCKRASIRLSSGKSYKSKRSLLDYSPEEFENYLIEGTEFSSIAEAMMSGYHLDHIVPISYISEIIEDKDLQFRIAMDLENLRLIPAEENFKKGNRIDFPEVVEVASYLSNKYKIPLNISNK